VLVQRSLKKSHKLWIKKLDLESRGIKANNKKGVATASLLKNDKATTKDEKVALEKNLNGLENLTPLIKDTQPKTQEVFNDVKKTLKKK